MGSESPSFASEFNLIKMNAGYSVTLSSNKVLPDEIIS